MKKKKNIKLMVLFTMMFIVLGCSSSSMRQKPITSLSDESSFIFYYNATTEDENTRLVVADDNLEVLKEIEYKNQDKQTTNIVRQDLTTKKFLFANQNNIYHYDKNYNQIVNYEICLSDKFSYETVYYNNNHFLAVEVNEQNNTLSLQHNKNCYKNIDVNFNLSDYHVMETNIDSNYYYIFALNNETQNIKKIQVNRKTTKITYSDIRDIKNIGFQPYSIYKDNSAYSMHSDKDSKEIVAYNKFTGNITKVLDLDKDENIHVDNFRFQSSRFLVSINSINKITLYNDQLEKVASHLVKEDATIKTYHLTNNILHYITENRDFIKYDLNTHERTVIGNIQSLDLKDSYPSFIKL
ncbi:hypothetical protein [Mycoplasma sp. P36-A1]|uniref:hypothetical protein n=1 Tax=Mycoplasma sp. P36-A1 TaxID=3252900 RepID=UPI003C2F3186